MICYNCFLLLSEVLHVISIQVLLTFNTLNSHSDFAEKTANTTNYHDFHCDSDRTSQSNLILY